MISKHLKTLGFHEFVPFDTKYVGKFYKIKNDFISGTYWFYKKNDFILDIQDLQIKKDYVSSTNYSVVDSSFYVSTYFKQANGDCLSPYVPMTNNSLLTHVATKNSTYNTILHGGFPYLAIGLKFDAKSLSNSRFDISFKDYQEFEKIFLQYNDKTTKNIKMISDQILNLDKSLPGVDLILDGKIMEWIGVSISSYYDNLSAKSLLTKDDILAIEKATNYIDNHYMLDINQGLLEKITLLSGTKLKKCFKIKTGLTITEYVQRKRIDMGEIILASTDLNVKNVAESVGYSSHSRFSELYKKYKGVSPSKVKFNNEI
ncbi:AraC family transcriptional regulator [Facklamia miroungae]|uniref:AraC-type DNA-binding protein n=1 Tax=Facklamia miroungae TaxID=120956 RepID=A0A1G7UAL4_9LACT|nr:AraC family transcriptional regulator [Facklamia miroungae]NKZ30034.1 helix-turn-helix transcriptional regulator [Facklamia miroungae]SDG44632.1 AraC-type DNA-binding protein [Facklamia miroungae]